MNAGEVYRSFGKDLEMGYTRFYEVVKKFDAMRLVDLEYRDGKGRTRVISMRYEPDRVLEYLK
jgi:cell division control protein 6